MIRKISLALGVLVTQGCGFFMNAIASEDASPALKYRLPSAVVETSGLAEADNLWWTINDSGDDAVVYGLSPDNGKVVRRVELANASNHDWEDLARDDHYLYIADTGNNRGSRKTLTIYKVHLDDLKQPGTANATALKLRYADYKEQTRNGSKPHNVDCEAIVRVNDTLWLLSKNRGDQKTRLYKAAVDTDKVQLLEPVSEFDVDALVTAADYNPNTRELAVLTYGYGPAFGQAEVWRVPVVDDLPDWKNAHRHSLARTAQWEAILWKDDKTLLLSAEGSFFGSAQVAELGL